MQTLPDSTRIAQDTTSFGAQLLSAATDITTSIGLDGPVWPIVLLCLGGIIALALVRSLID